MIRENVILFLKGIAMGAANVIPGVSGGTIAFITGIYEDFISSLKAFDTKALSLLLHLKTGEFARHINLRFLTVLMSGVVFSLFTVGKLLDYLFIEFSLYVWSFFFGLIAVSVLSVGRTIVKWTVPVITWGIVGIVVAVILALMTPASENSNFIYLIICGIVAIASMILPGLSGSFVLILMGNYQLIMLQAIPSLNFSIIIPVAIGAVVGFILLSHVISFFLKKFHDVTISTLTGFILGSLIIIWPWKIAYYLTDTTGNEILKNGKKIIQGYEWNFPELTLQTLFALFCMLAGVSVVLVIEKLASTRK
ncbi:MAG: DUF368 domain-containing protein [Cyclobacteriaceae bacterium]|nr:DUF368 domain-containing protein [Cyclobacteriaceae bacterium]